MMSILIVEDDATIRDELAELLRRNGYDARTLTRFDRLVDNVASCGCGLVLLDLNLPGIDGAYACRAVRARCRVPIVVVTSRDTDMDELLCMSFGADDFVAKPYNPQILLARIAAVLKRTAGVPPTTETPAHRGLSLDTARCLATFDGRTTELTKNEQRILALLLRSPGEVLTRQRIQEELWQASEFVDDNTLTVNMSHLRRKLASIGADDFVQTRRGVGYLLE